MTWSLFRIFSVFCFALLYLSARAETCEKLLDPRTKEIISFLGFTHPAQENAVRNASSTFQLLYLLHWSRGFTLPARSVRAIEDRPLLPSKWTNLISRRARIIPDDTLGLDQFVPGVTKTTQPADYARLMGQATAKFPYLIFLPIWHEAGREVRTAVVTEMVINALSLIAAVDTDYSFEIVYPTSRENAQALRRLFLGEDITRLAQMVKWTYEPGFLRHLLNDTEKVFPLLLARHNALTIPIPRGSKFYQSPTEDDPSNRLLSVIQMRSYLLQDSPEKTNLARVLDRLPPEAIAPPSDPQGQVETLLQQIRALPAPTEDMTGPERDQYFAKLERHHTHLASAVAGLTVESSLKVLQSLGRQIEGLPEAELRATDFIALIDELDKFIGYHEAHQNLVESMMEGLSLNHRMVLANIGQLGRQLETLRAQSATAVGLKQLERKFEYQDMFSRVSDQSIALAQASIENDLGIVDQIRSFKTLVHMFAGQKANAPQTLTQITAIKKQLRDLLGSLSSLEIKTAENKE